MQSEIAPATRKGYQALADQLRDAILDRTIPAGALLPNERDLGDQAGLSRGSVREALRLLEMQGLVATRLGRNGGSVVRRPGPDSVSRSLESFLRGQDVPWAAVLEAREAIEPALAHLAARHRSDKDLEVLAEAASELAAAADNTVFVVANSRWHWAVAEASHNPVLISLVTAIRDLLHRSNTERVLCPAVRAAVVAAHAGIEAAIRAGDADAARRRMARHLHTYRNRVRDVAPEHLTPDLLTPGDEATLHNP